MAFQNREELIDALRQVKRQLEAKWLLESLALFGSWVRDNATPNSDVDLIIQFKTCPETDKIYAFEFVGIQLNIEEALEL
jgi:uncharacterized protein